MAIGDPDEVADRYLQLNFEGIGEDRVDGSGKAARGRRRRARHRTLGSRTSTERVTAPSPRDAGVPFRPAFASSGRSRTRSSPSPWSTRSTRTCSWRTRPAAGSRAAGSRPVTPSTSAVSFENALAPGRYAVSDTDLPSGRPGRRSLGEHLLVRGQRGGGRRRHRRPARTRSSIETPRPTFPTEAPRDMTTAHAGRAGRPIKGPSALGSDARRLRPSHAHPRRDGVQAALLRLGARLLLAAHAAADAVRDPLRGLHAVRAPGRGSRLLPGDPAHRHRPLHLLRGRHQRLGHGRARPREPRPQDRVPTAGRAAVGDHARLLQPGPQPPGRARVRADHRRGSEARVAGAAR